jgi:hypothetical protein
LTARIRRPSCGLDLGPIGEDLLQVHHLTRYELGDGEGDNRGRSVDVGDRAARFGSGETTKIARRNSA